MGNAGHEGRIHATACIREEIHKTRGGEPKIQV